MAMADIHLQQLGIPVTAQVFAGLITVPLNINSPSAFGVLHTSRMKLRLLGFFPHSESGMRMSNKICRKQSRSHLEHISRTSIAGLDVVEDLLKDPPLYHNGPGLRTLLRAS